MVTAAPRPGMPQAPLTVEETGLSFDLLEQLVLKTLHFAGETSAAALATRLGLLHSVLEPVLQHLKREYLCDLWGGGAIGGPSFVYRLTDAGRGRAMLALDQSRYVGAAPVPFAQYAAYMRAFDLSSRSLAVTRASVRRAFGHLVLSDRVLDQLGPAVNGGHSLFVYGPPGNGKTVISQAIGGLLGGEVCIPHALDFDGHLLQVYDPAVHQPVAPTAAATIARAPLDDMRWLRCARPLVTVGGELTLEALELSFNPASRAYQAPIQLLANGGVLVIDDFGRQRCSVVDLLNRWINPLESRTDYLTLQSGQKMPVPFVVLVVFATNIKPADLVDEAFLRRIHYKVFAENPSPADFTRIFERCCREHGLGFDDALVDRLVTEFFHRRGIALRGCHPRDLIEHALALTDYTGAPRQLTSELLLEACASYFLDDQNVTPASPA